MNKPRYILGIDLAFTNVGICLLDTESKTAITETIVSNPKNTFIERCISLSDSLNDLYDTYAYLNPYIAVELVGGSQSAKAAKMGGASYGIFFSSVMGKLPMVQYGPKSIKNFVGHPEIKGYGRKALNIAKAEELYPLIEYPRNKSGAILRKSEHISDAVIIAHLAYLEF
jgi:Holliday junction resolvasome RuvABC endonuclease subunit